MIQSLVCFFPRIPLIFSWPLFTFVLMSNGAKRCLSKVSSEDYLMGPVHRSSPLSLDLALAFQTQSHFWLTVGSRPTSRKWKVVYPSCISERHPLLLLYCCQTQYGQNFYSKNRRQKTFIINQSSFLPLLAHEHIHFFYSTPVRLKKQTKNDQHLLVYQCTQFLISNPPETSRECNPRTGVISLRSVTMLT